MFFREGEIRHKLELKYKYLKILVTDEISMTGGFDNDNCNNNLKKIKHCEDDYGGLSVIDVGDFFQLPPVDQGSVFSRIFKQPADPWLKFRLHELKQIVRQSDDPDFAQLLNRVREGNFREEDVEEIKNLANTDTSEWQAHSTMYMTNHLVNKENNSAIFDMANKNNTNIITIQAKDSRSDITTGRCPVDIPLDVPISKTGNLIKEFKCCLGARVMPTYNQDTSDGLINGLGTVKVIDRVKHDINGNPIGRVYVEFDQPKCW